MDEDFVLIDINNLDSDHEIITTNTTTYNYNNLHQNTNHKKHKKITNTLPNLITNTLPNLITYTNTKQKNINFKNTEFLHYIEHLNITCLINAINGVERTFGNYLFDKYIKSKINIDGLLTHEIELKYTKAKDTFKNEYFTIMPSFISQEEEIIKELEDITLANAIYIKHPEYKKNIITTVYGYPDRYRCEFITVNKHKFSRCKSKVYRDKLLEPDTTLTDDENNDAQYLYKCKKHLHIENKYIDDYHKLISKFKPIKI